MVVHGIKELSYREDTNATMKQGDYSLTLTTNSPSCEVKLNQAIYFFVSVEKCGIPLKKGLLEYVLKWDQSIIIEKGFLEIKEGKGKINVSSAKPGFIKAEFSMAIEGDKPLIHRCGVAINPELIEPSLELPGDFDEFWNNSKELLAKIPIDSKWTPIDQKSHPNLHNFSHKSLLDFDISDVEINDVQVSSFARTLSGIYTRPVKRALRKHPAMLCVQGAGVMPTQPHNFIPQAKKGILVYEMGVHGISNLEEVSYYQNLLDGRLKGYMHFGREDKNSSYFRAVFLGVKRGLDFLMSQPEWDGKTIVIRGSSQGGVQCMAGAYLEPLVSMISARVPALCDHTGFLKDRSVGGGKLVAFDKDGKPDPVTLESSRYFDGVNFMRRLNCRGSFSVGLIDGGCSPSSIFTAYNTFKGQKSMIIQPYTGHANTPETIEKMDNELDEFCLRGFKNT